MELVLKNLKSILITLALIAFAILVYLNSSKLINWLKSLFTNINIKETPTTKDLNTPTYKIDSKIIKNYVDTIVAAIRGWGTDEKALDNVYQNLQNTDIQNTIDVWNEFKNRRLLYDMGDFNSGILLGEPTNLHEVLRRELTGFFSSASEKNCWTNWDHLLRVRAHLV